MFKSLIGLHKNWYNAPTNYLIHKFGSYWHQTRCGLKRSKSKKEKTPNIITKSFPDMTKTMNPYKTIARRKIKRIS